MRGLFVDTSAWFALFVASDPAHEAVADLLASWPGAIVTTDYVFDELVTLVRYRVGHREAVRVGETLRRGELTRIHVADADDTDVAWARFVRDADKAYSFTDCASFAVMERLGLDTAAALDAHSRQAGFVVVPCT